MNTTSNYFVWKAKKPKNRLNRFEIKNIEDDVIDKLYEAPYTFYIEIIFELISFYFFHRAEMIYLKLADLSW